MIYFVQRADGAIKIGFTDNFQNRLKQLEDQYGALKLLGLMDGGMREERWVHERFSRFRVEKREWFSNHADIHQYIADNTHLDIPVGRMTTIRVSMRTARFVQYIAAALSLNGDRVWTADDVVWYALHAAYSKQIEDGLRVTPSQ